MTKGRGNITAEELLQQQRERPDYFSHRRQLDLEQEQRQQAYREAAAPVLTELASLGFEVRRIIDLGADGRDYRAAVPVLLRSLDKVKDRTALDEIVRALTDPVARPEAGPPLLGLLRRLPANEELGLRWTTANALSEAAGGELLEDLTALIRDESLGRAREPLLAALPRIGGDRAVEVAVGALDDPQLTGHAVEALRKLRAVEARDAVAKYADHPTAWVRKEVATAVRAFDRERGRRRHTA